MIKQISYTILFIFAFAGMYFVTVVLHEYSHFEDYKLAKGNVNGTQICGLVLPETVSEVFNAEAGYFSFYYVPTDPVITHIEKYTENKAYTISVSVIVIFVICVLLLLIEHQKGKLRAEVILK